MNPPASVFATSPDPITPIFMSFSFERCEDYTPLGTPIADPAGSCRRPRCSSHPRRRNPGCCRSRRGGRLIPASGVPPIHVLEAVPPQPETDVPVQGHDVVLDLVQAAVDGQPRGARARDG